MLAVASLDSLGGPTVPVLGSFAALPAAPSEPEVVEVQAPPATPGTCLNWTRADASDTHAIDCTQAHLFEQAGTVLLADQTELPDDAQDNAESPLEQVIGLENSERYEAAMLRLRDSDREAIVARIELRYSYQELAVALGKPSPDAARVAVARAVYRLAQEISRGE